MRLPWGLANKSQVRIPTPSSTHKLQMSAAVIQKEIFPGSLFQLHRPQNEKYGHLLDQSIHSCHKIPSSIIKVLSECLFHCKGGGGGRFFCSCNLREGNIKPYTVPLKCKQSYMAMKNKFKDYL